MAGLAAYALYKYTKMTEEEKQEFVSGLKEKGKKFYDQNIPEEIKSVFAKKSDGLGDDLHGAEDQKSFNDRNVGTQL